MANTLEKTRRQARKALSFCTGVYFDSIPMDEIMQALDGLRLTVVDEAGERWSGIFCGESGYGSMVIKGESKDLYLHLSWYKMPSGRYEIVAGIS